MLIAGILIALTQKLSTVRWLKYISHFKSFSFKSEKTNLKRFIYYVTHNKEQKMNIIQISIK